MSTCLDLCSVSDSCEGERCVGDGFNRLGYDRSAEFIHASFNGNTTLTLRPYQKIFFKVSPISPVVTFKFHGASETLMISPISKLKPLISYQKISDSFEKSLFIPTSNFDVYFTLYNPNSQSQNLLIEVSAGVKRPPSLLFIGSVVVCGIFAIFLAFASPVVNYIQNNGFFSKENEAGLKQQIPRVRYVPSLFDEVCSSCPVCLEDFKEAEEVSLIKACEHMFHQSFESVQDILLFNE